MYKVSDSCQVKDISTIYMNKFGYTTDGFFVEVGASDGYYASNVYGLIEAGWKGLCIEPNVKSFASLKERYKDNDNVTPLCFGIGDGRNTTLYMAGALSTTSEEQFQKYKDLAWLPTTDGTMSIRMFPLYEVLETNKVNVGFEVLVIDTEGTEYDVLKTFGIEYWLPKMCIVEVHENHPLNLGRNIKEINLYFEQAGYNKIYSDEINNIYTLG